MGTRDSALDSTACRPAQGGCGPGPRSRRSRLPGRPTARPMQHSWEALGSPSGSLAKGRGALAGVQV